MPKTTKAKASQVESMEGFEGRYEDFGEFTVGFESFGEDSNMAPMFVGLPDDRCQCPHWGTVHKGELTYTYADGTKDVIGPGESYYAHPGHTPAVKAGTEITEFSPTADLAKTIAVIMKNVEKMSS